jgi:hypothetical protein
MSYHTPIEDTATLPHKPARGTEPKLQNSALLGLTVLSFLFAVAMAADSIISGVPH